MINRLFHRGWKYTTVGVTTFIIDMGILFALVKLTPIFYPVAVAIGFLIGVSINYYLLYHWVFSGTERKFHHGYLYFVSLAILGAFMISGGTALLYENLPISLLMARTIMGGTTGFIGFFVNSFFNFKMV